MSKVNSLRKIISKLNDGEIPNSELDTVVKCLDKIAEIVSDTGGSSSGDDAPFELIETITVSEAVKEIERTAEPDGTPYNFRKLMAKSSMVGMTGTTRSVDLFTNWGDSAIAKLEAVYNNTNVSFAIALMEVENMRGFAKFIPPYLNGNDSNATYKYDSLITGIGYYECEAITSLKMASNQNIPVGSTFEIYAVRK